MPVNHTVVCKDIQLRIVHLCSLCDCNFFITFSISVIQQKLYHHEAHQIPEVME